MKKNKWLTTTGILVLIILAFVGFIFGGYFIDSVKTNNNARNLIFVIMGVVSGVIFLLLEINTLKRKEDIIDKYTVHDFNDFMSANIKYLGISIIGGVASTITVLGWYNIIKNIKSIWLYFLNTFFPDFLNGIKLTGKFILLVITNKWVWIVILSVVGVILVKYILYRIFIKG